MQNYNLLKKLCQLIRYDIVISTTTAGSGHPTSSLSAVELMTTLFFGGFLRYDLKHSENLNNDRVIFSKGHAAPLLYSLYHAAGAISYEELMTLRKFNSVLEGHPTPRFKYVDVATGSLGQGLSMGVGMALGIKLRLEDRSSKLDLEARSLKLENQASSIQLQNPASSFQHLASTPRVWVLLGDSEMAEGQVWEALEIASYYKLNNLIGILDVNRLGQQSATMLGWDLEIYEKRISSFGWGTIVVDDGHDLEKIYNVFKLITNSNQFQPASPAKRGEPILSNRPLMIIAKTVKGKGISFLENKEGWHGKAIPPKLLKRALKDIGKVNLKLKGTIKKPETIKYNLSQKEKEIIKKLQLLAADSAPALLPASARFLRAVGEPLRPGHLPLPIKYKINQLISTREAYGDTLVELGKKIPNLVVFDAEVANSTFENKFQKVFPERFFEMFIAEENAVSAALGISKMGFIPFFSTFAAFLTQAFDQIRMSQYSGSKTLDDRSLKLDKEVRGLKLEKTQSSNFQPQDPVSSFQHQASNLKLCGSHAGVSLGADGPSQMGLEDIAMMRSVLESVVFYPADAVATFKLTQIMARNNGLFYLRTTRGKTPVIYKNNEEFKIGGAKILRQSENDQAVIFAAGVTLYEALKAHHELKKQGINVAVVDLYCVKPLDKKTVSQMAEKNKKVIVVEDHYPAGGLGEAVAQALLANFKFQISNFKFTHLCVRKIPHSGTPEEQLHFEEIDAEAIARVIKALRLGEKFRDI